jgi:hypothetical protein
LNTALAKLLVLQAQETGGITGADPNAVVKHRTNTEQQRILEKKLQEAAAS